MTHLQAPEHMMTFPQLVTARLLLRRLEIADLPALVRYANNSRISDQILNIPHPYREEDAIQRMNFILQGFKSGDRYVFAITLTGNNDVIGEIGIHLDKVNNNAQLGYWVAEPFWGRNIASEAAGAVIGFGFETLALQKIYATHYPENHASGKVMAKNGMIKEGELKEHYKVGEQYRTVHQYRLTKDEYRTFRDGRTG